MATKSIIKNIVVDDTKTSCSLLDALEKAQNKGCQNGQRSSSVRIASDEDIKKIFGENNISIEGVFPK
jgi:hypothetical protein